MVLMEDKSDSWPFYIVSMMEYSYASCYFARDSGQAVSAYPYWLSSEYVRGDDPL